VSEALILALDFGGTKHSLLFAEDGGRGASVVKRVPAPPNADAAADCAAVFGAAHQLLGPRQPAAIGVSFGGPVDYSTGTVRLSHHVPGWENVPLQAIVEKEFHAPARVDNDANVAALGEYRFGAGQAAASLMYITVSTGVGGGWILNGDIWRGQDGMAGELGHVVVDPAGPVCLCGKRGCVERLASGPYLAQHARELLLLNESISADPASGAILRRLVGGDISQVDARRVAEAAAQGDALAVRVLAEAAHALGVGIGNAANLINPSRFVIGGGVTKSGEAWWQAVRQAARATALPEVLFDLVPAGLGDDAPLWGAVALAPA
jgi:glucokinase